MIHEKDLHGFAGGQMRIIAPRSWECPSSKLWLQGTSACYDPTLGATSLVGQSGEAQRAGPRLPTPNKKPVGIDCSAPE
ncbi:MAG: hypothetical protein KatS3mg110_0610 [Pirellulaceae bacterium]|nr:MAG: hypothetical protein KatS3mg110_0610 [Pirellulaceae bacterium]